MSIWMLLIFALSMGSAVFGFGPDPSWPDIARPLFFLTLAVFLIGVVRRGIRKPVV